MRPKLPLKMLQLTLLTKLSDLFCVHLQTQAHALSDIHYENQWHSHNQNIYIYIYIYTKIDTQNNANMLTFSQIAKKHMSCCSQHLYMDISPHSILRHVHLGRC